MLGSGGHRGVARAFGALAVVALASVAAGDAIAQPRRPAPPATSKSREPSSADVRLANDLYKTGLDRVKDAQWEQARDAFARAYELYPQPVILANLAGAEVRTGRIVAGVEHYRQLLKQPTGMSPDEIELVARAMKEAETRLAHLKISVANTKPGDRVELDGAPLSSAALEIEYPVDPGSHVITASRTGAETARTEVDVKEGESKPVKLSLRSLATSPLSTAPSQPATDEKPKGITSSPWFWIVSGVVVVGAAAATVCIASVCRDDGYQGNLGAVTLP